MLTGVLQNECWFVTVNDIKQAPASYLPNHWGGDFIEPSLEPVVDAFAHMVCAWVSIMLPRAYSIQQWRTGLLLWQRWIPGIYSWECSLVSLSRSSQSTPSKRCIGMVPKTGYTQNLLSRVNVFIHERFLFPIIYFFYLVVKHVSIL